ncbi:MAG: gluconate 2-dehydrogenase subunit 3 family protein [Dinghuibacter sp.]|nr:gluconate 2-dehydrogenase subunit 3 family protein [Dinghuibacter sp.]
MDRRELLKTIAVLTGASFVGGTAFLSGCKTGNRHSITFTDKEIAFLDEVADTILPDTPGSPGAKAAKTGEYIKNMVIDCYEPADQDIFMKGIEELDAACKKKNSKGFMECTPEQRTALLLELDKEAKAHQAKKSEAYKPFEEKFKWMTPKERRAETDKAKLPRDHYFTMMKQLSIAGYFSSEIGHYQARRHKPVPGGYNGCMPYKKGDKAWA